MINSGKQVALGGRVPKEAGSCHSQTKTTEPAQKKSREWMNLIELVISILFVLMNSVVIFVAVSFISGVAEPDPHLTNLDECILSDGKVGSDCCRVAPYIPSCSGADRLLFCDKVGMVSFGYAVAHDCVLSYDSKHEHVVECVCGGAND